MKEVKKEAPEKFLRIEELASKVEFSRGFIRRAVRDLSLPHYKIGGAVRFRLSDWYKWLEQRKVS